MSQTPPRPALDDQARQCVEGGVGITTVPTGGALLADGSVRGGAALGHQRGLPHGHGHASVQAMTGTWSLWPASASPIRIICSAIRSARTMTFPSDRRERSHRPNSAPLTNGAWQPAGPVR